MPVANTPKMDPVRPRMRWIWLLPIAAAILALALVGYQIVTSGPTIVILFKSAEGLAVDRSKLRYKSIEVGTVSAIELSEDRKTVAVSVKVGRAAREIDTDAARFWLVTPQLGPGGISGLGTLVSGTYIEGDLGAVTAGEGAGDKRPQGRATFIGMDSAPGRVGASDGTYITLRAPDLGQLSMSAPVYYRKVKVGEVVDYTFGPLGRDLRIKIFVQAPYDKRIDAATQFWRRNAIDFSINSQGARIRTDSAYVASLGGIEFGEVIERPGTRPIDDAPLALHDSEEIARQAPDGVLLPVTLRFKQSVRGLNPGSIIDFDGIVVGRVEALALDAEGPGQPFYVVVSANLFAGKIGDIVRRAQVDANTDPKTIVQGRLLAALVRAGMRASLQSVNPISGQKYISLDVYEGLAEAPSMVNGQFDIPTIGDRGDQLQAHVDALMARIATFPTDQIASDVKALVAQAEVLLKTVDKNITPQARALVTAAERSLVDIDALMSPTSVKRHTPQQLQRELQRAVDSLQNLTDYLSDDPRAVLFGRSPNWTPPVDVRN